MIPNEFGIEGSVAVVTGAGRGIGRAISLVLAEGGADVVVASRTISEIEETANEVRKLGRKAIAVKTDVTRAEQVENLVKRTIEEFGKVDILVNNAGVSHPKQLVAVPDVKFPGWKRVKDPDHSLSDEEWRLTMDSNVNSIFFGTRAVGPYMLKQRSGKVINISSNSAVMGVGCFVPYNTSKAAVCMFTRCLAIEWAPFNINVNAIGPGDFYTRLAADKYEKPELKADMLGGIPMGYTGNLRDLGLLALYLASPASNYMTGQTIFLDGGSSAL
jgi:NAD(P)-dependent dehydrogenase (short-subunit alcohol dehydrogenase family)